MDCTGLITYQIFRYFYKLCLFISGSNASEVFFPLNIRFKRLTFSLLFSSQKLIAKSLYKLYVYVVLGERVKKLFVRFTIFCTRKLKFYTEKSCIRGSQTIFWYLFISYFFPLQMNNLPVCKYDSVANDMIILNHIHCTKQDNHPYLYPPSSSLKKRRALRETFTTKFSNILFWKT